MTEAIQQSLETKFPGAVQWEDKSDMPSATVPAAQILPIVQHLFSEDELGFQFLTDLTAVHFPDRKGEELCVVYHLHNLASNVRIRLKAYVPIEQPDIESMVPVFSGANWMERETYDFYGVNFLHHPNLTRILNVDEMDYFPMRKEYPMEDPTRVDKDDEMFGRGGVN